MANGSVVKASSFDWEEFSSRRAPWLECLESLAGSTPGRRAGPDWKRLFESTRALTEKREDLDEMIRMGFLLIRDLMQIQQDEESAGVANIDLRPRLKAWARRLDLAQLELLKRGLDQAYRLQTRNINQQLSFDALVTQIAGENRPEPPNPA